MAYRCRCIHKLGGQSKMSHLRIGLSLVLLSLCLVTASEQFSIEVDDGDFQFFRLEDDPGDNSTSAVIDSCDNRCVSNPPAPDMCMFPANFACEDDFPLEIPEDLEDTDILTGFYYVTSGQSRTILADFTSGKFEKAEMKMFYFSTRRLPEINNYNIRTLEEDGYHGFVQSTAPKWDERCFEVDDPSQPAFFTIDLVGADEEDFFIVHRIELLFVPSEPEEPEDPDPSTTTTEDDLPPETTTNNSETDPSEETDPPTEPPTSTPPPNDGSSTPGPTENTTPTPPSDGSTTGTTPGGETGPPSDGTTPSGSPSTTLGGGPGPSDPPCTEESSTPSAEESSGLAGWEIALISVGSVALVGAAAAGGIYYFKTHSPGGGGEHARLHNEDFEWNDNDNNAGDNDNPGYAESVPAASVYNYNTPSNVLYTGDPNPAPGHILPRLTKAT